MIRTMKYKMINLLGLLLFLVACTPTNSQDYCLNLENSIKDVDVQKKLIKWVDETFNQEVILRNDLTSINNVRPGYYSYKGKQFDWNVLGFDNRSRNIQLIGVDTPDFSEKTNTKDSQGFSNFIPKDSIKTNLVNSIFFADKRWYGILVKLKHSDIFIETDKMKFTKKASDRIAVFCKKSRYSKSYYEQDE